MALHLGGIDEHRMVLADDLIERIAERAEKIVIGADNSSVDRELDDRLRPVERLDDRILIGQLQGPHLFSPDRISTENPTTNISVIA